MGLVQGDVKVTFTVDDREYRFDLKRCTGIDVNICRRSTGYGPIEMVQMLQSGSADIDVIAALAWLARRQNGERSLPFEAVASKFNYDIDLHVAEKPAADVPAEYAAQVAAAAPADDTPADDTARQRHRTEIAMTDNNDAPADDAPADDAPADDAPADDAPADDAPADDVSP